jgi:hypothetical protein
MSGIVFNRLFVAPKIIYKLNQSSVKILIAEGDPGKMFDQLQLCQRLMMPLPRHDGACAIAQEQRRFPTGRCGS